MQKTDRMLLIEERASKDIKDVLSEAFDAKGTLQGASSYIEEQYGVKVAHNILALWVSQFGGIVRKTIEWVSAEAEPAGAAA